MLRRSVRNQSKSTGDQEPATARKSRSTADKPKQVTTKKQKAAPKRKQDEEATDDGSDSHKSKKAKKTQKSKKVAFAGTSENADGSAADADEHQIPSGSTVDSPVAHAPENPDAQDDLEVPNGMTVDSAVAPAPENTDAQDETEVPKGMDEQPEVPNGQDTNERAPSTPTSQKVPKPSPPNSQKVPKVGTFYDSAMVELTLHDQHIRLREQRLAIEALKQDRQAEQNQKWAELAKNRAKWGGVISGLGDREPAEAGKDLDSDDLDAFTEVPTGDRPNIFGLIPNQLRRPSVDPEDEHDNGAAAKKRFHQRQEEYVKENDGNASDGSDYGSDYSKTEAATQRRLRKANQGLGPEKQTMDFDEEDDILDNEYIKETKPTPPTSPARTVGKGKGKEKESEETWESEEEGEPEEEDEEELAVTPWDIVGGQLGKALVEEARVAKATYDAAIEDVARRAKKKVSAVRKAIGDESVAGIREGNGWNAFQMKYRAEHPRSSKMSKEEVKAYSAAKKAAYRDLFSGLSPEEAKDPGARRRCLEPLMEWYEQKTKQLLDVKRGDGAGKALLSKAVEPLIHHSTTLSNKKDIEVWGFAMDLFADNAIIWGGGGLFHEVFKQYPGPIKKVLTEFKARFQAVALAMREEHEAAEANAPPPVIVVFHRLATETSGRDAARRQVTQMFVNAISRGDDTPDSILQKHSRMSWKWSDTAVKEGLRIACWPASIKDTFPSKGFSLSAIAGDKERERGKDKEKASPLEDMRDQMRRVYEGAEDDQCPTVESWTQDERDLEDPSNVPIVTCVDGTVLLRASESRVLASMLQKKNEAARKGARGKSAMPKRKVARSDHGDATSDSDGEGTSRPKSKTSRNVAGPSNGPPAPGREVAPKLSKFRFHNPENSFWSDTFTASGIQKYQGAPTIVQENTYIWSDAQIAWKKLPPGALLDARAWCARGRRRGTPGSFPALLDASLPLVNFDTMGTVGLAGAFAGLDLFQNQSVAFDPTTSTLFARASNGSLTRLASSNSGGRISAGCSLDDVFYLAGSFSSIEGIPAANIASYTPSSERIRHPLPFWPRRTTD
ncbi:hypothetical protein K438DRAFT_1978805 [Mycena galopus ATCC 62051]|nr:hypothetical protein K438DRAFT_1978805 [Mycena galopus ATCC 62051]